MRNLKFLIFSLLTASVFSAEHGQTSKPPHIVFLLIDDLGWNDVSFHGSKQIPTPNIDAIARDGVILNNYYVQPICTPSRGALMTGKHPIKLGLQHDVLYSAAPWGLSLDEKILPQYLKDFGYATRGVGKWHLGYFRNEYLPTNRGFDSFFGYWNGKEDFYTHLNIASGCTGLDFHDDEENAWNYTNIYSTDIFTEKSIEIIRNHNASQPLFLYVSHQAAHAGNAFLPLQAPPEYIKRFEHIEDHDRRVFAGMVSALDDSVGDLFTALEDAGFLDDTIFVFTTDNGGAVEGIDKSTGSNYPLRGAKYTLFEGGVRANGFVWSPALRKAKTKISPALMTMTDWLPTLYSKAGGDINALGDIDGLDIWPTLCLDEPLARDLLLHNIDEEWKVEAIRKGKYKLVKGSTFNGSFDGWYDKEGKIEHRLPFTPAKLQDQDMLYQELRKNSTVIAVLTKKYGDKYCFNDWESQCNELAPANASKNPFSELIVNCPPPPQDEDVICHPLIETCLYDIEIDPCEQNNLAKSLPSVVKELEGLLDDFRSKAVPIRNVPEDPASNPKFHGYAWVPWLNDPIKNTE